MASNLATHFFGGFGSPAYPPLSSPPRLSRSSQVLIYSILQEHHHKGREDPEDGGGQSCAQKKKKLQDLEREWEEVCWVSVERQDWLEQVYRHIGQFGSHLVPLQSWMAEVLPMLDDSEPVHDEIDTTDNLMN